MWKSILKHHILIVMVITVIMHLIMSFLHVVAENDKKVFNSRNEELLTVEIKFEPGLYEKYTDLINNPCVIACQNEIGRFDNFLLRNWLHSLLIERLQEKSDACNENICRDRE